MSDEHDETRSFSPFDDATWADDAGPPGRGRDRSDDRSRRPPRTPDDHPPPTPEDATLAQGAAPTRADSPVVGGATGGRPNDATSVMPPAAENPAWSGRAEVRAPQPAQTTYQEEVDWPAGPGPQQPRDRWWMPILVGILVLVLLAVLGWGLYLIVQNADKNDNSPAPAATTSAPPAPTTAATTQPTEPSSAPTTTTPTPTSSTTDPTDDAVGIPALRGLTVTDAKAALKRVGINSTRVIYRTSRGEPDTVIDSDPEEGQEVPPDTTVTLVVAAPSTATTNATATATRTGN